MDDDKNNRIDNADQLDRDLKHYRHVLGFLGANAPIECLCLPKNINDLLRANKVTLVFDLIDCDIRDLNGIGRQKGDIIRARLDEFLSIGL